MLAYYAGIVCQHLSKEVSIWKMPAYYAGIVCWHLTNRNLFAKMLAYYAGIICWHLTNRNLFSKMPASYIANIAHSGCYVPPQSVSSGRENCPLNIVFFLNRKLVSANQAILMTSLDLRWLIMTCWCLWSWFWPLLSKKTTFYDTHNLTLF